MKSLRERFIAWVANKPRDEQYDGMDSNVCAYTQFCEANDIPNPQHAFWEADQDILMAILPDPAGDRSKTWTFGALSDRLSSLSPKGEPSPTRTRRAA